MKKMLKLVLLLLIIPSICFAETIVFKSGEKREGKVIEKNNDYIKIEYDSHVTVTYPLDQIESINETAVPTPLPKNTPQQPVKNVTEPTIQNIPAASIKAIPFEAIKHNDVIAVKKAIEEGADVNAETSCVIPLAGAAIFNSLDVAKLLIDKGADVNASDMNGRTALHHAAVYGGLEMVRLLIEKGADVNKGGNSGTTALIECALGFEIKKEEDKRNYLEIAKLLITKGADVNAKSTFGTALMNAARRNFLEMAKLLIEKGADVNVANFGATALMVAAMNGSLETVKLLIGKGANVNAKDRYGETALIAATQGVYFMDYKYKSFFPLGFKKENFFEIVKLLIGKGADINAKEKDGKTALTIAEENKLNEIAVYLRQHGAK